MIGLIPFIPGSAGGAFLEWMAKNADKIPVGQVDEFLTILSRSKNLGDDVVAGATDMLRRANAGIDEFGNKLFNNRLNPAFAIPDGGNIPNSGMLDNAVAKMDGSADNFANKGDDVVQETTEKTAKEASGETLEETAEEAADDVVEWQHSDSKHANKAPGRGWQDDSIQSVLDNPADVATHIDYQTGDSVTIYYRSDGHYVVRNDVTGDIIHVSNTNDPGWIDPLGDKIRPRP